jgi:hypothetical protein
VIRVGSTRPLVQATGVVVEAGVVCMGYLMMRKYLQTSWVIL